MNDTHGSNKLIISHSGCWDGFCAAWLMHTIYPDAEYLWYHHGDEPPTVEDVAGRDVYILDFSFDRETLIGLHRASNSLIVLDHHKSAEEALQGLEFCTFDSAKSGARLTLEYILDEALSDDEAYSWTGEHFTWLVDYTEDRDLWKWELKHSREINAALRSYPLDFDVWDDLSKRVPARLVLEGEAILRYQQGVIESGVRHAGLALIAGHEVLVTNSTTMTSEIAGELAKDRPFGVCWFEKPDGTRIYSLRSTPTGLDVSEIAKRFGGGGHKHAAGFEVQPVMREVCHG